MQNLFPDIFPFRLLLGTEPKVLSELLPAVEMFARETKKAVYVRTTSGLHDRYLFIDGSSCYHSGSSFKDGAKRVGTILSQITDAFPAMSATYESLWAAGKAERA